MRKTTSFIIGITVTALAMFALAAPLAQAAPSAPEACMQASAYPGWVNVFDEQGVPWLYPTEAAPFQSCSVGPAQPDVNLGASSPVGDTTVKSPYLGWIVVIDDLGVPTLYPIG